MKKHPLKLDPQLSIALAIFLVSGILIGISNSHAETTWPQFVLVLNNTFMNILVFGVFLTWLDKKRRQRHLHKNYLQQLEDFRFWAGEEGVWRKVGILRRLREMDAPLPSLSGIEMANAMMESWNLSGLTIEHANFSNAFLWQSDLSRSSLQRSILERTYLENATIDETDFTKCFMSQADLRETCGQNVRFICANLEMAMFQSSKLQNSSFEGANLEGASFAKAMLADCTFYSANLEGCDFAEADLTNTDFRRADLSQALHLSRTQLENAIIDDSTKLPLEFESEQDELREAVKRRSPGPIRAHFDGNVPHYRPKPEQNDHRRSRSILDHF